MHCVNCGTDLEAAHKFCGQCGAAVPAVEPAAPWTADPDALSPNIRRNGDGVYRWTYHLSLYRHPIYLFLLWKIFFWVVVGMFLFFFIIDLLQGSSLKQALGPMEIAPLIMGIFFVLSILGYCLYAVIMGGKYSVDFEMDEEGVNHVQVLEQANKARWIGILCAILGALAKNPTTAGMGMMTASRTSMYSSFRGVRKVVPKKHSHLIKVKGLLRYNMVYAGDDDFDAVYEFIRARCPMAQK